MSLDDLSKWMKKLLDIPMSLIDEYILHLEDEYKKNPTLENGNAIIDMKIFKEFRIKFENEIK